MQDTPNIELIGEAESPRLSVNCNYSYNKERPWCVMLQSSWATPLPVRHGDKGNAEASSPPGALPEGEGG